MSGDSTAVGAEARAVENGMGFRLGRVKGWAPYGELPGSRCRQSFHNDHGSGTFWTTEAGGRGGSGTGQCRWMGPWVVQQQTLTEREEFRSTAIGQESEGTDADKAAGQNMEKETSQELLREERHLSLFITVRIILPAKGNLITLEGHQTVVGDGDAMGVAGEITQHMMGSAEGGLGVDDPVLTEQGTQEGAERFLVL
jgi:hypothetical protein